MLRRSDLAREGLDNGGSFRFADHIYRSVPSGRGAFGHWLDAQLLALPAVRSFRNRYFTAVSELLAFLERNAGKEINVLSVPSGIPRELLDVADHFRANGGSLSNIHFHVLDLDSGVLGEAERVAHEQGMELQLHHGDAFDVSAYAGEFDYITCTGFGEFLNDIQFVQLMSVFHRQCRPGGGLFTSAMRRRRFSDYLLRLAELNIHYRSSADLEKFVARAGFKSIETWTDEHGIQRFLRACK
jgi:hypothetical protein